MNLYKANLLGIWFTNSAWAVFRYPALNFKFKCFRWFLIFSNYSVVVPIFSALNLPKNSIHNVQFLYVLQWMPTDFLSCNWKVVSEGALHSEDQKLTQCIPWTIMLLESINSCGVLTQNCLDLIIHYNVNDRHYKYREVMLHVIYLSYDLLTFCRRSM